MSWIDETWVGTTPLYGGQGLRIRFIIEDQLRAQAEEGWRLCRETGPSHE